jgi:hypothetical protein
VTQHAKRGVVLDGLWIAQHSTAQHSIYQGILQIIEVLQKEGGVRYQNGTHTVSTVYHRIGQDRTALGTGGK